MRKKRDAKPLPTMVTRAKFWRDGRMDTPWIPVVTD
jgi:hypothetical protein